MNHQTQIIKFEEVGNMATIDLHMHSVISIDGELEPEEVIRRAVSRGIRAAALTDHNSVRGVSRAWEEAARLGIIFWLTGSTSAIRYLRRLRRRFWLRSGGVRPEDLRFFMKWD